MGYTSERTNINKSLESLNQETQRLQKQTNYEFDRLDQRRRQNQSANMNWLAQNQRKLDMGMQQYQELQDSYEPDTGYTEKTKAMMSGMRDEYYNLLQNKVPKLDGEGNPLKDKQGNVIYEENIRAANEQRDKLMKGVKETSMAQGNFAGVQGKMDAALSINNEAPGSLDPRTNADTTALFKPGVQKVPRWDSKSGKVVFDIRTPKMGEDGEPVIENGEPVYEEEVRTISAGEFNRDVESGAIGILTYGDGGEDRNALQTEAFDQHYKDKFSKFKDMTDLNDINTYNDFRETFAGYEKHLSQMDVSKILDDNQGMSKNWTDVLNRIARNASSDFYGDNENPFRTMLEDFGLKDEDGDGKISGDELNAIGGAWKPGNTDQRALAEKFYRTYDPSSGILPTYLNDMLKTSQTIGADQLSQKDKIKRDTEDRLSGKVTTPTSNNANKNKNKPKPGSKNNKQNPKAKFPTYQIEDENGEKSDFNFEEDLVTDEGTYKFSPTSTPSLIVVDGPNGKEVINTSGTALSENQRKLIEDQAKKQNIEIKINEKDRLDELNSKKKSDSKVDDKQEKPVEDTTVDESVNENQADDTEAQADDAQEEAPEEAPAIEGDETNEQVEEITNEQVESDSNIDKTTGFLNNKGGIKSFTPEKTVVYDDSNLEALKGSPEEVPALNFMLGIENTVGCVDDNGNPKPCTGYAEDKDMIAENIQKINNTHLGKGEWTDQYGNKKLALNNNKVFGGQWDSLPEQVQTSLLQYNFNSSWDPRTIVMLASGTMDNTGSNRSLKGEELDKKWNEVRNSINYTDPAADNYMDPIDMDYHMDYFYDNTFGDEEDYKYKATGIAEPTDESLKADHDKYLKEIGDGDKDAGIGVLTELNRLMDINSNLKVLDDDLNINPKWQETHDNYMKYANDHNINPQNLRILPKNVKSYRARMDLLKSRYNEYYEIPEWRQ